MIIDWLSMFLSTPDMLMQYDSFELNIFKQVQFTTISFWGILHTVWND